MIKDKERILKAAREKQVVTLQGSTNYIVIWFLNGNISGQKGVEWNIQGDGKQGRATKATLSSKATFKIKGEIRSFPDKKILKEIVNTKPVLQQMLKGLLEEEKGKENKEQRKTSGFQRTYHMSECSEF